MIIRTLTVFERDAVRNFYLALSTDDRRKRFCCTLSDETISKYVDGLDFTRHTILGAFNEHAQLIGLAELALGVANQDRREQGRLPGSSKQMSGQGCFFTLRGIR